MERPVSDVMARTVYTAFMEDTVEKVEEDLNRHRLHAMPVVDSDGSVFGILSSTDLLHFHATKRNPKSVRAWELCTYKPTSVSSSASMREVAGMMVKGKIHHILVTDGKELKGIVSTFSFLEHLLR